jgi:transmembrane sensor
VSLSGNPDSDEIMRLRQASEWLLRLEESADPALIEAYRQWCAQSPQNRLALERMQEVWEGFAPSRPHAAARARAAVRAPLHRRGLVALAAAVGALLIAADWLLAGPSAVKTLSTAVGEPRHLTLSDGSQLDLAPASRVSVRYSLLAREVRLERGEAYFSAAPGAVRPFVVKAGGLAATTRAAGLDVRADPDGTRVAVSEGSVEVSGSGAGREPAPVRAGPGQQVSLPAGARDFRVTALGPKVAGCWRQGILPFVDEPLPAVVAEVNRYVQLRIVLTSAARDARFTGTVKPADLGEFLEALRQLYPVDVLEENAHAFPVTYPKPR